MCLLGRRCSRLSRDAQIVLIFRMNSLRFSSFGRRGRKAVEQSFVLASPCFSNHSTISASEGSGRADSADAFTFFGLGTGAAPSSALRLLLLEATGGLPERLAAGLVARLDRLPARGLVARLPADGLGRGIFGLVARFATMECPPKVEAVGDVARDVEGWLPFLVVAAGPGMGGGGVGLTSADGCEGCDCCCWIAGPI
jgi:hypothetical protein